MVQLAQKENHFTHENFIYEEALLHGPYIRYVILQPADEPTDDLICTLHTTHLDDVPPFEAISYVWGTSIKDQAIICNGKTIDITANLLDVLRQIRDQEKPRTLWIDSLCINQSDAKEKGHQVSLMEHIYVSSRRTLICLGTSGSKDATLAASLVADVDNFIQGIFEKPDFDWTPNSFPFANEDEPLLRHPGWTSYGFMLQKPWFRRGWVVQEAALGPDALVLWAGCEIEWLKLVRTYVWRIRRALSLPSLHELWLSDLHLQAFYIQRGREAAVFRPKGAAEPLTCLEILEHARWLGVSDPRDRIYAFLSLLRHDKSVPALQPSYEVSHLSLYLDFASELLKRSQDLDILHFVHNDDRTLEEDFPSWVPRWDVRLFSSYTGTLNNYSKTSRRVISKTSPTRITLLEDGTALEVGVVFTDTIAFKAQCFDKDITTCDDVISLWQLVSSKSKSFPYPCTPLRAFISVFRCGVYRGRLSEWVTLQSAYMRLLQGVISNGHGTYKDAETFHRLRMEDVHNKSFVLSHRGYYGLAPGCAKEGDLCCFMFGTRSPFILRRTNRAGYYKMVGSVLILGSMLDHNGNPEVLGMEEINKTWTEWGLKEETAILC